MQSLLKSIHDWSQGGKGFRFAQLSFATAEMISLNDLILFYKKLNLETPIDYNTLVVEFNDGNIDSTALIDEKGNLEEESWKGDLDNFFDEIRPTKIKYKTIIFLNLYQLKIEDLCHVFVNLRDLDSENTVLLFLGPYTPELYCHHWSKSNITNVASPFTNTKRSRVMYDVSYTDIFYEIQYELVPEGWGTLSEEKKNFIALELCTLTNFDIQIIREIISELKIEGIHDLSRITNRLVKRGDIPQIVSKRFDSLDNKQKEIVRDLYRNGYYSIEVNDSDGADLSLVEIEPLFLNSLAKINFSSVDHYFLTPFSPLCNLIINENGLMFGIEQDSSSSHYDVNHAAASRLVNTVENFFRDKLKQHIKKQFPDDKLNDSIGNFLKKFKAQDSFEKRLIEFLELEAEFERPFIKELKNSLRKNGFWNENQQATFLESATDKRRKSSDEYNFNAEQIDLFYFLDPFQLQYAIEKEKPFDSYCKTDFLKKFFLILNKIRNDVSHNRPICYEKLVELEKYFEKIHKMIGKQSSSHRLE